MDNAASTIFDTEKEKEVTYVKSDFTREKISFLVFQKCIFYLKYIPHLATFISEPVANMLMLTLT